MKRWNYGAALLLMAGLLGLSGCSQYPDKTADGAPWDHSWTILGSVLGVEEPGNGFSLLDNYSVLTGEDIYYAAWVTGEPAPYTNEDGEEVEVYDAQIYLLAAGCADEAYAQQNEEEWMARQQETYAVTKTWTETRNGQEYTLLAYECGSETNPYERGYRPSLSMERTQSARSWSARRILPNRSGRFCSSSWTAAITVCKREGEGLWVCLSMRIPTMIPRYARWGSTAINSCSPSTPSPG